MGCSEGGKGIRLNDTQPGFFLPQPPYLFSESDVPSIPPGAPASAMADKQGLLVGERISVSSKGAHKNLKSFVAVAAFFLYLAKTIFFSRALAISHIGFFQLVRRFSIDFCLVISCKAAGLKILIS